MPMATNASYHNHKGWVVPDSARCNGEGHWLFHPFFRGGSTKNHLHLNRFCRPPPVLYDQSLIIWYIHMWSRRPKKRMVVFTAKALRVKNLGNGLPTQRRNYIFVRVCFVKRAKNTVTLTQDRRGIHLHLVNIWQLEDVQNIDRQA